MGGFQDAIELAAHRFWPLPADCGNSADPGIVASPDWRDWTDEDTSVDQQRIEAYLDTFSLRGTRILHVGVGNSSLAKRFAKRAKEVIGLSIDQPELALARELGLANYRVFDRNKYAAFDHEIDGKFDFIIDNNITSACCCLSHLFGLLERYRDLLAPTGQVLTDREGLGWTPDAPGRHSRWQFSVEDLSFCGDRVGLTTEPVGAHLIALSRGRRSKPNAYSRTVSRGRRRLRQWRTRRSPPDSRF